MRAPVTALRPVPRPGRRRAPPLLAATALAGSLAAAMAAPPAAAQSPGWSALPVSGIYIGAAGGLNGSAESDLTLSSSLTTALRQSGVPVSSTGEASFNLGYALIGSIGYGFGNGLRAELEANYRHNDIDEITGFGRLGSSGRLVGAAGSKETIGGMVNLFYDFIIPELPWVVPYLGLGAGIAGTRLSNSRVRSPALDIEIKPEGGGIEFAYQFIAGAAFPIAAVPGLAVTAEARYFATLENAYDTSTTLVSTGQRIGTGTLAADNRNVSVTVGLRYNFGRVPPPAPVPVAAAPAPARSFLVFFDFDRADLTERARQIVAEAAQASSRQPTTRIEVAGHADRSGSPAYNLRLSQRRAEAVAAELVRQGVSRGAISVQALGESRPLVPTADGVREPQNRRVEIILR